MIQRANGSCYGLVAGVFTNSLNTAQLVSRSLDAGTVWINNCWHAIGPAVAFGGHKESGTGVECGQQGIESFTKVNLKDAVGIHSTVPAKEECWGLVLFWLLQRSTKNTCDKQSIWNPWLYKTTIAFFGMQCKAVMNTLQAPPWV